MGDIKTIIEKIYKDYNPDKVSSIPSLLEKYKGKESEMLSKIIDKYCIRLQDYIKVDYLLLVTEILKKYEPVNVSSATTLLSNNKNHEDELLTTLCNKYNAKLNDIIISIYNTTAPALNQKVEVPTQKTFIPGSKIEKKDQETKKNNTGLIFGISSVVIIAIVLILFFSGVFHTKKKADNNREKQKTDSTNAAEKAKREADSLAEVERNARNNNNNNNNNNIVQASGSNPLEVAKQFLIDLGNKNYLSAFNKQNNTGWGPLNEFTSKFNSIQSVEITNSYVKSQDNNNAVVNIEVRIKDSSTGTGLTLWSEDYYLTKYGSEWKIVKLAATIKKYL